jgi:hypothetical protein
MTKIFGQAVSEWFSSGMGSIGILLEIDLKKLQNSIKLMCCVHCRNP